MTRSEAIEILRNRFPGCQFFVEAKQWIEVNGVSSCSFGTAVYFSDVEGDHVSGYEPTLEKAVDVLLRKAASRRQLVPVQDNQEVAPFFNEVADLRRQSDVAARRGQHYPSR